MKRRFLALLLLLAAACGRSDERPGKVEKPVKQLADDDGVFRLAALGDSLAYGAGDESGEGIAGRLEDELRRLGVEETADADAIILSIGANDLSCRTADFSLPRLTFQIVTTRDSRRRVGRQTSVCRV